MGSRSSKISARTAAAVTVLLATFASDVGARNTTVYEPPKPVTPDAEYECNALAGALEVRSKVKILSKCGFDIPEACEASAKFKTVIRLLVDLTETGAATNLRIVETSNACFDEEAANAVAHWKFDNKGVATQDVEVQIRLTKHSDQYEQNRIMRDITRF